MIWAICSLLAGAILIFFWLTEAELEELTEEDREYKDPLPPFMRLIWPIGSRLAEGGVQHPGNPGQRDQPAG